VKLKTLLGQEKIWKLCFPWRHRHRIQLSSSAQRHSSRHHSLTRRHHRHWEREANYSKGWPLQPPQRVLQHQ
jgi:hypothetical protein